MGQGRLLCAPGQPKASHAGTVTNCYVEAGSISGNREVGGLVGWNGLGGTITDSYCTGAVGGDDKVGGLLGANSGIVTNCWSTCGVDASNDVGGLVGDNDSSIMNSWSHAGVEGRKVVGGLVGRNAPGEIVNCYAWGSVAGKWYVGGLVGSNVDGEVTGCFWDVETSGRTRSYGGTRKTTAEMQTADTFLDAGWDFVNEMKGGTEDIWWIPEGRDYPRLWWEPTEDGE